MSLNLNLTGRRALVCGASRGIGKAIANDFAKAGASLVLLARNEDNLKQLISELPNSDKHSYIAEDIDNLDSIKEKVLNNISSFGNIHILINNTGGPKGGSLTEAKEEEFMDAFKKHLVSASTLSNLLIGGMKQDKYGRIINIISTSVKSPIPNLGVSNTVRSAVANWSKTLSVEVAPFGITVNNVLPGYTDTERLSELIKATATRLNKSEDEVRQQWKDSVPAGRFASPEETAHAVTFLASDLASYINGINLPVDGGRTVCL